MANLFADTDDLFQRVTTSMFRGSDNGDNGDDDLVLTQTVFETSFEAARVHACSVVDLNSDDIGADASDIYHMLINSCLKREGRR